MFEVSDILGKHVDVQCTHHNNQPISARGLALEIAIAVAFTWCVALKKVPGTLSKK